MCSKPPKYICENISRGGPGVPRRAKRARGSALGHPGRGHVEMRGPPGPSGCGARDPITALLLACAKPPFMVPRVASAKPAQSSLWAHASMQEGTFIRSLTRHLTPALVQMPLPFRESKKGKRILPHVLNLQPA
jgi:hypothetical protein